MIEKEVDDSKAQGAFKLVEDDGSDALENPRLGRE
jgi:hypothetical protein